MLKRFKRWRERRRKQRQQREFMIKYALTLKDSFLAEATGGPVTRPDGTIGAGPYVIDPERDAYIKRLREK